MPAIRPIVRRPKGVVRKGLLLADRSPHKACQHRPTSSLLGVVSADRTREQTLARDWPLRETRLASPVQPEE